MISSWPFQSAKCPHTQVLLLACRKVMGILGLGSISDYVVKHVRVTPAIGTPSLSLWVVGGDSWRALLLPV
jgi:hypothetical protein